MFKIDILGSGSSGNCIMVDTGDCRFLLDAGLSFKDTKCGLRKLGIRFSSIDLICLSHGHHDHLLGLKNIVDKYNIPVITSSGEALTLDIPSVLIKIIKHGRTVKTNNLEITAYDLPHDTNEPLYFSIKNSVGEKLLYLTDCGTDDGIDVEEHDVFIIEANYHMAGILESLKSKKIHIVQYNRVTEGTGHLEINQTINILKNSVGNSTKHIILSHLSSSNGNGELFIDMVKNALDFNNVYTAKKGLSVEFGENPNIF